jgi:hypothetical protein
MSLSRIIAAVSVAGMAGMYAWKPQDTARLAAADAMLAVAHKRLSELDADRAALEQINNANLMALESVKADLERQAQIAEAAQATANKRAAELNASKKRIKHAPKSFDGPVAPVLRRELDELRADGVRPVVDVGAPADASGAGGARADQPGEPDVSAPSPAS